MKTLREKWIDALPIIWGIISVILLMYLIVFGISKMMPTNEERKFHQEDNVRAIKLCTDNGLKAYQGGDSYWYCKP